MREPAVQKNDSKSSLPSNWVLIRGYLQRNGQHSGSCFSKVTNPLPLTFRFYLSGNGKGGYLQECKSLSVEKQAVWWSSFLSGYFSSDAKQFCIFVAYRSGEELLPVPGTVIVQELSPATCSIIATLSKVASLWLCCGGSPILQSVL